MDRQRSTEPSTTDVDRGCTDPPFAATLTLGESRAHLRVRGDIDISTCDVLSEVAVDALRRPEVREVVLDLAFVTFLDAAGLGSLVTIRNASQDNGKQVTLVDVPGRVSRLLTLTDLLSHFTLDPSRVDRTRG